MFPVNEAIKQNEEYNSMLKTGHNHKFLQNTNFVSKLIHPFPHSFPKYVV